MNKTKKEKATMTKNKKTFEENLKRFRRWLCENAVARVVNGFLPTFLNDQSKKIQVVVDDGLQPCTDGKTIHVSLIPHFLEKEYSEEEWLLVLKAAAAHEAQHINSSNFSDVQEIQTWYGDYLSGNYGLDSTIGKSIARNALNIIEDGRIERIAVIRRPGMYYPFRFLNDAIREGTAVTGRSETPSGEYDDFWGAVLSYAKTGMYSPGIEAYAKTRLETVALGIQSLVDDGIASDSSSECRSLVQELLEDAAPYITDLIKADPDLENALKENPPENEYTSNMGKSEPGNSAQGGNPLRVPAASVSTKSDSQSAAGSDNGSQQAPSVSAADAQNTKDSRDEEKKPDEAGRQDDGNPGPKPESEPQQPDGESQAASHEEQIQAGFCSSDNRLKPLSESEMDDLKKQLSRELSAANREEKESQNQTSSNGLSSSDIESIRAVYSGNTAPVSYETLSITGCSESPVELKSQATALRREIIRIREARSRDNRGLRRGTLDSGALWKTGLRDDTIFCRKKNPNAGSVVFYLNMDNSGSMAQSCSDRSKDKKKYQAARIAAAVIEEATKGIIPCKIALFNQDRSCVNHTVIKEFDEKKGGNHSWNSLSVIGPGGCNADSVNIRISALELSRRPERKKVLLVLSDGTPSAYGSRSEALAEVRQAVLDSRRKGIVVIPIMFGEEDFLNASQKAYETMYEKNIIACDPAKITDRLCALFRQVICR